MVTSRYAKDGGSSVTATLCDAWLTEMTCDADASQGRPPGMSLGSLLVAFSWYVPTGTPGRSRPTST